MLSRRSFCQCVSLAFGAGLIKAAAPTAAWAQQPAAASAQQAAACAVMTPGMQQAVSPDDAIAKLMAGNARFVGGHSINCDLMRQVRDTARKQAPFAAIVGCIDSRVPPELVFDQRIGDVFCARIAGNFVNTDIIGSLEFATKVVGARAIMVLGHSDCGAIKGAVDDVKLGNLTAALAQIRPAVAATTTSGERNAANAEFVQGVAETNVRMAMARLVADSSELRELVSAGQLRIVGAMHDVATGQVALLT